MKRRRNRADHLRLRCARKSKRGSFVGTDDYAAGGFAAEEVRDALSDGESVIISVGSLDTVNGCDRRQGLIDNRCWPTVQPRPHA